jgi:hypothetical protein
MKTPVKFELAKLLKEKGFDKRSEPYRYNKFGETTLLEGINAPTIAEVVMWLYEKHKIWITSEPCIIHNGITNIHKIFKDNYLDTISRASKGYNSPIEAYEAAIDYTLNNLI